jgi:hypothetical protein
MALNRGRTFAGLGSLLLGLASWAQVQGAPYRVEQGDTLWDLAMDRYPSNPWKFITLTCEMNGIPDPDLLEVGWRLDLPEMQVVARSRVPGVYRPEPPPSAELVTSGEHGGRFTLQWLDRSHSLMWLEDNERKRVFPAKPSGDGGLVIESPNDSFAGSEVITDPPLEWRSDIEAAAAMPAPPFVSTPLAFQSFTMPMFVK